MDTWSIDYSRTSQNDKSKNQWTYNDNISLSTEHLSWHYLSSPHISAKSIWEHQVHRTGSHQNDSNITWWGTAVDYITNMFLLFHIHVRLLISGCQMKLHSYGFYNAF